MTSSFSTVIGTPRDDIPKLPTSNYADSAPDLTEAVEEGNEAYKEDLARHFESVAKIEELRVKNFWDNLTGLEQFLGKAAEVDKIRVANRDAEEKIRGLKDINKEELDKQSGKLDRIMKLEEAERVSELIKLTREGDARERLIATDLLNQNVLPTGEEIKFDDAKTRFNNTSTSVLTNIAEKNFLITQSTLGEAKLVADNAIRDILTDFYYEMRLAGFDINSRQVQNYVDRELLPSLMEEKDRQVTTWTALRPSIVQKNLQRKNKNDIIDAFTSKGEVTTISASGAEIKTVKHNGVFDAKNGEGGLLERLMSRNNLDTKAEAVDLIIQTLESDPLLMFKLSPADLEYFKEEARFLDASKEGKEIFGFANSNFSSLNGVMKFFDKYESKLATSNKEAFDEVNKIMQNRVAIFLADKGQDKLEKGQPLHFIQEYNNELRKRGLSTNLPTPGFLLGDETIEANWSYAKAVKVNTNINTLDWEGQWKLKNGGLALPLTAAAQIEKAKADLQQKVLADLNEDDNLKVADLIRKYGDGVIENLNSGKYEGEIDLLRPLLPADTEKEITSMTADKNNWLDNTEVNSVYEKRYLDEYIEDYVQKGYNPRNIPTYIKKLARAAGMSTHDYIMRRFDALKVYDKDTMKFLSKNPEDQFNLTEKEKKYLFVKPHSSKNLQLYNTKEGGLNGKHAEKALSALRVKGQAVDSFEGRDGWSKIGAFFAPGDQTITVEKAYNLAKQGGGTDFGLYKISGTDIIRLVDAGILDPDAEFDENTQDFAAFGLMYLQANDSNGIMGANVVDGVDIGVLDWKRLTGLTEAQQAAVLQFFPNLKKMPLNQFQNMQADVSEAILNEVEVYQRDLTKYLEENPDKTQADFDNLGGSPEQIRRSNQRALENYGF
tara:strand:- start:3693 stop:6362 length:2670 start_codon:yes stop_codon:yes gene_type:complete